MAQMLSDSEFYINHETRIRLLERLYEKMDSNFNAVEERFDHLEEKINYQYQWIVFTTISIWLAMIVLFGGFILHLAKIM